MNDDALRAKIAAALRAAADAVERGDEDLRAQTSIIAFSLTYDYNEHATLLGAYSAATSHNAVWGEEFPSVQWGVAITVQDVDLDAHNAPLRDVWGDEGGGR